MDIAVLVSGGVDSSVALHLLKEQGYNPTAFYIKIWLEEDFANCPWDEDIAYATKVTKKLGVPFEVVSLQKEYWDSVIAYTFATLKNGKTPNPDILCNSLVKFGVFDQKHGKDFKFIGTGHYAQIVENGSERWLKMAKDQSKDQSYFLAQLSTQQLSRALFPVGGYLKPEIREIAKKLDLPTHNRPDSQGLCFIGKINFTDFLKQHIGEREGEIREWGSEKVLGSHKGFWLYTIGQRGGLRIGGSDRPYYVASKDSERNIVYVAKGHDHEKLMYSQVQLDHVNILAPELLQSDKLYQVKLRTPQIPVNATVRRYDTENKTLELEMQEPAFGVAEGQFGVIYDHEVVVACGEII